MLLFDRLKMIIDLRTIKRSGKDESEFFFEYSPSESLTDLPLVQISLPIKVTGKVILTGEHSAMVDGEVFIKVVGECTRCLEETAKEFVFLFAEELETGAEHGYSVVNDKIDLTKIVDDCVMMNMPINFLCSEDCRGICAGCGVNLNHGDCKCEK